MHGLAAGRVETLSSNKKEVFQRPLQALTWIYSSTHTWEHTHADACEHAHTRKLAHTHTHTRTYLFTHKRTHTSVYTYVHTWTYTHTHTQTHTHIHTHTHTNTHTRTHTHTHTHTRTHAHTRAHPHTQTHTHTHGDIFAHMVIAHMYDHRGRKENECCIQGVSKSGLVLTKNEKERERKSGRKVVGTRAKGRSKTNTGYVCACVWEKMSTQKEVTAILRFELQMWARKMNYVGGPPSHFAKRVEILNFSPLNTHINGFECLIFWQWFWLKSISNRP